MNLGKKSLFAFIFPTLLFSASLSLHRVTADKLRIRLGPGQSYESLGLLSVDEHVVTCGKVGEWHRIYLPKKYTIYVHEKDLNIQGKSAVTKVKTIARKDIGINSVGLGDLPAGTSLRLKKFYGAWWTCEAPLCLTAYVHEKYIRFVTKIGEGEENIFLNGRRIVALPAIPKAYLSENKKSGQGLTHTAGKPQDNARTAKTVMKTDIPDDQSNPTYRSGKTDTNKNITIQYKTLSEAIRVQWNLYVQEKSKGIDSWNFQQIRQTCQEIKNSSEKDDDKALAGLIIERIDYNNQIRDILNKPLKRSYTEKNPEIKTDKKVNVTGWIIGQGKYIGRPGTHILMKGNKIIYYLVGDGIDLDVCVNKRVAITRGNIEDLPPQYGCKLFRVKEVKELTY